MTDTRGRRVANKERTEDNVGSLLGNAPLLVGAGLLEHGLDSGDDLYVWANRTSQTDISGKLRAGFKLVKFDDVKARLEENGIPAAFYNEDENGNVTYGVDLILMVGSRAEQERRLKLAYADQLDLVQDASESELRSRLDDVLSTTNVRAKDRPRISKDEDHGTKQTIELKETK